MKIVQSRRKIYSDTKFRRNVWDESGVNLIIDTTNSTGNFAKLGSTGTSISLLDDIIPSTNGTLNLGTTGYPFANAYIQSVFVDGIYSTNPTNTNILFGVDIIPTTDNKFYIGSGTKRFANIYSYAVTTDAINTVSASTLTFGSSIYVNGTITALGNVGSLSTRVDTGYFNVLDVLNNVIAGTIDTGTINNSSADLNLKTTTSGNIVLNPVGNIIVKNHVVPDITSNVNLGSASLTFGTIYVDAVSTSSINGTVSFNDSIDVINNITLGGSLGTATKRIPNIFANSADINVQITTPKITVSGANLDLETVTSGDVFLNPAGNVVTDAHILPNVNSTYNLGSTAKQFKNLYVDGSVFLSATVELTSVAGTGLQVNSGASFSGAVSISGDVSATTVTVSGQTIDTTRIQSWDNTASSISGKADVDLSNITSLGLSVIDTRAEIVEEELVYVDELLSVNLEAMFFDTFTGISWIDQTNTTATQGDISGKGDFSGTSGQTLQSINIYFDDSGSNRNVNRVMVLMDDWTGKTVEVTADGGTTWDTVTQDSIVNLSSTGTDLRYKVTFGTGATPLGSIAVLFDYSQV